MGLLRALGGTGYTFMIISLVILLYIGASLTIMTDTGFYLSEFEKTGIYANFEDMNEPPRLAQSLTAYFKDGSTWPPEISGFTLSEGLHLRDVKLIVLKLKSTFYFFAFLLAACLFFMIALYKGSFARNLPRLLLLSGTFLLGVGLLLALAALAFTQSFLIFHHVFFPQGNWQFSAESTLIRLFPEQFFLDAFLGIIFRVGFFALLLLSLGLILRRIRANNKWDNQKEL